MANIDSPPDWSEIDEEILCPLCEYNLRGLAEPRCPECGYRFDWLDMLDPGRRLHRFLFEHHPERKVWSFWKTASGGFLPRRFWSTLQPVQPSFPKRLLLYWCLVAAIILVCFTGQYVHAAVDIYSTLIQRRNWDQAALNRPQNNLRRQIIVRDYGSVREYLDTEYPLPPSPSFFIKVFVYDDFARGFTIMLGGCVLWPWMTFVALLIFRWSMRRARVKPMHVFRCVIYSFDVGLWIGLVILLATIASLVVTGSANLVQFVETGILLLCFALALEAFYRLWMAYRIYMQFDHSFLTIFSSQIIVLMVMFRMLLLLGGM